MDTQLRRVVFPIGEMLERIRDLETDEIVRLRDQLKEPRFKVHRGMLAAAEHKLDEAVSLLAELQDFIVHTETKNE